jgi:predicted transcriptional regulator
VNLAYLSTLNRDILQYDNNLNTKSNNTLLMSRDVEPDQTVCKECGKSFDTTEGLEQHYELEHKWENKKFKN